MKSNSYANRRANFKKSHTKTVPHHSEIDKENEGVIIRMRVSAIIVVMVTWWMDDDICCVCVYVGWDLGVLLLVVMVDALVRRVIGCHGCMDG